MEPLARGLGWFSVGLGLVEMFAPVSLGNAIGLEDHAGLLRSYGGREAGVGVALLTQKSDALAPLLWARFAGDMVDLGTLGVAYANRPEKRAGICTAIVAVLGVTALDVIGAVGLGKEQAR